MSESQNENTKQSAAGEEIINNAMPSDEIPEQEKIGTIQATAETNKEKHFFGDAADNVGEGAKIVGEKTTELADKLKKGLSQAYAAGAKVVGNLSQAAHEYAEKYKAESEIKKLNVEKDNLMAQLGESIFQHHQAGHRITESFFSKQEIVDQFDQIEMLNKKIIETGKQLDIEKNTVETE